MGAEGELVEVPEPEEKPEENAVEDPERAAADASPDYYYRRRFYYYSTYRRRYYYYSRRRFYYYYSRRRFYSAAENSSEIEDPEFFGQVLNLSQQKATGNETELYSYKCCIGSSCTGCSPYNTAYASAHYVCT